MRQKQKTGAGAGPSGIGSKGARLQCRFGSTPGLACQQPAKAAPLFPGAKANTKKVGQNSHWDGSEPTSAVAGQRPAFATTASASPEAMSSQGSSIARDQCLTVVAKNVAVLLGNQRQQMPDCLETLPCQHHPRCFRVKPSSLSMHSATMGLGRIRRIVEPWSELRPSPAFHSCSLPRWLHTRHAERID